MTLEVSPSDIHVLSHPDHPCFLMKDGFLGRETAGEIAMEARAFQRQGKLKAAGMSRGEDRWAGGEYRGDEMVWLSVGGGRKVRDDSNTTEAGPAMRRLLAQIERLCGRIDILDKKYALGDDGLGALRLECNQKSAQLAYYPGNGKGYVRHCDSFSEKPGEPFRCLTFLYYLNADWEESQGGQLRLYLPNQKDGNQHEACK